MKILVYTEKPKDGREIAKVLSADGKLKQGDHCVIIKGFDGNDITVYWAIGHAIGTKTPKEMGFEFKYKTLPIQADKLHFIEIGGKGLEYKTKNMNAIKKLYNEDFDLLVFAGDSGREGLAIMDRINSYLGNKLPIEYLWKNDCSKNEIRDWWGRRLKADGVLPGGEYIEQLSNSAYYRALADWKIGMNFSQLYMLYYRTIHNKFLKFRVGRVIMPTLNFIQLREEQIENFKPSKFYRIKSNYKEDFSGMYFIGKKGNKKIENKDEADLIISEILNEKIGIVEDIRNDISYTKPKVGYKTSKLAGEMSKKLKIKPKGVDDLIDDMYNNDGIMSYPRVESQHITKEECQTITKIIKFFHSNKKLIPEKYHKHLDYAIDNNFKTTIKIIDEKKVIEGHGALHIKSIKGKESEAKLITFINGTDKKSKIFQKIFDNNLSFFLAQTKYSIKEVYIKVKGKYDFVSEGKVLVEKGWKELSGFSKKEIEGVISIPDSLKKGDAVHINNFNLTEEITTPPSKLTYQSLLDYMGEPKSFFTVGDMDSEEKENFQILSKAEGIGTGATRSQIIENIMSEKYAIDEKGFLSMSDEGKVILSTIDDKIKDVLLTAEWEKKLYEICHDKSGSKGKDFLNDINTYIGDIIGRTITQDLLDSEALQKKGVAGELIDKKSPEGWNLYMREKKDMPGKFYVTSDDNKDAKNEFPLYYSLYNPKTQEIEREVSYSETKNKCPLCSSDIKIVLKAKTENEFLAICTKNNLLKKCNFISKYDLNKDELIYTKVEKIDGINCPKCGSGLKNIFSNKTKKHYAVCEKSDKKIATKDRCLFIQEYDEEKKELVKGLRDGEISGIKYKGEDLIENDKVFATKSGNFLVWKKVGGDNGIILTKEILAELIKDGVTSEKIDGFVSKKGKEYSTKLELTSTLEKNKFTGKKENKFSVGFHFED